LKNKNIVICSNYAWTIYTFRLPLIRELERKGYCIYILTQRDNYTKYVKREFKNCFNLYLDRSGFNPFHDITTCIHIIIYLLLIKPNALLTFTIKPNIYGGFAARLLGVPHFPNITGLGTTFIGTSKLLRIVKIMYKLALSKSTKVFFQNNDDSKLFNNLKIVSNTRSIRLPGSGIDLKRYQPSSQIMYHTSNKRFRFLLVSRMLWDKGIGEYVAAARYIINKYQNVEFCLLGFLGIQNPSAISYQQMNKWIAEGVVSYLGVSDDVRKELSEANCVVLPSYREGMSLTLLEASAAGRAIVTTNVPGCRDAIIPYKTGLLVPAKNAKVLANSLKYLIKNDDIRMKMGRKGRIFAKKNFDIKKIVVNHLIIYKDLLS